MPFSMVVKFLVITQLIRIITKYMMRSVQQKFLQWDSDHDKFRFESKSLVQNLSYKQIAQRKTFDAPLDSNQLGIFLSPTKEVNMDIIKSLPDFSIDDYIGQMHQYKDDYPDLLNLRKYVFGRYNLNIYEYINIIKYIDKSLFETIKQMIPQGLR